MSLNSELVALGLLVLAAFALALMSEGVGI
jgi:hypothetical protein